MEPKLPQGLVAMSSVSPSEIFEQGTLSSGAYKNLWQAYSTSHQASKDETECRLEHFFWRIWGAKQLSSRMNTHTLDCLILRIKASTVLVGQRVTVTPLPGTAGSDDKEEKVNTSLFYIAPSQFHIDDSCKPINNNQSGCAAVACSPHPILKKPQPSQAETHKATRLLLDTHIGTKITLDPSDSPTAEMAAEPTPNPNVGHQRCKKTSMDSESTLVPEKFGNQGSKKTSVSTESTATPENVGQQGPKKAYFSATRTGRGPRRRPVFNRRKSSQTSIPKTAPPSRRRSEPATKADGADTLYEDSYVELGLLQHLSFRDEEDQIARDLGREIAPEPRPVKPSVPLFDDESLDEPSAIQAAKAAPKTSPVPFPRASSLRHPMLSPEDFCKVTPSFGVMESHFDMPGGPQLVAPDDVEGDWTDIDALDSTLPVLQPFKKLVSHHENIGQDLPAVQPTVAPVVKEASLLSSAMKGVIL
ncbi:unnamed protein product [Penicillium nalgiovense]|uniref:Nitrogen regulatory protein areA GATA-like domain-containing protein n=1 Tax=Penicillium nalgiovense TaxID=60175 RepID=A0A9W4IE82_PENNA|nr:unnamed protein product [Penicillium nalgiovense]CAG8018899.1 unnamed protein product [Penicillium nalgiovense]CAG8019222.1 unnamed protein product [Penicillium nalgiovense]CAG8033300.1 unnamed protein product [Penicillium nalgiovense]CAG8048960.1 unnamed protein product [Penicillium nalgiovense]